MISSNSSRWLEEETSKTFSTPSLLLVKENYGNKKRETKLVGYTQLNQTHRVDCYKIIKHFKLEISENLMKLQLFWKEEKSFSVAVQSLTQYFSTFFEAKSSFYNIAK